MPIENGVWGSSVECCSSEFLWTANIGLYLPVSWVCLLGMHSDNLRSPSISESYRPLSILGYLTTEAMTYIKTADIYLHMSVQLFIGR
ncbi:hypothetical protein CEXT_280361 [Caerostris extrusa]|uniref:Uncharacterized protein n=1 Tax=Caerostris extrusa TaxID=172846 RepID=A0AAV4XJB0_CAEEX|nr:hypothetical protein CEXT_280361 [Caerostris extrusa]